jgi:hypothetical protein
LSAPRWLNPGFIPQRGVDLAHAAAPDQPLDAPGAQARVRSERRSDRCGVRGILDQQRRVEHALPRVRAEQFRDFALQFRVVTAGARQPFRPLRRGPGQRLRKTHARAAPSVRVARQVSRMRSASVLIQQTAANPATQRSHCLRRAGRCRIPRRFL